MLTLSPLEVTVMEKNTELFDQLGFEIELFGSNAYKVNAVPMIFKDRDIGQMIREILEDIATNKQPKDIDTVTQRMITFLACRSAIKAGDPLKDDQCQELIEELNALPGIYTCPHGRPIRIEWLSKDLDKLFYRL
jgi:DNA mismatch repair protein MutL